MFKFLKLGFITTLFTTTVVQAADTISLPPPNKTGGKPLMEVIDT